MSTQAGLAALTSAYAGNGLRLDFLAEHAARLAKATVDDVAEAARPLPRPGAGGRSWCSATPSGSPGLAALPGAEPARRDASGASRSAA